MLSGAKDLAPIEARRTSGFLGEFSGIGLVGSGLYLTAGLNYSVRIGVVSSPNPRFML